MQSTSKSATYTLLVDRTERNDFPPANNDKTPVKETQGRHLQAVESASARLSSQRPELSDQPVRPEAINSGNRNAVVLESCETKLPAADIVPDDNVDKSQRHEVYVQCYSPGLKTVISIPNPTLDPEGYELAMNAFIRTNTELGADIVDAPIFIDTEVNKIRSGNESGYLDHVRKKKYDTGYPL